MPSKDNQAVIRRLIGTWRLLSFNVETADGQVTYPFGREAAGYYIFTKSGYASVAIMRAHRPKYAEGDVLRGSSEEKVAAAEGYLSYCGRFEIQADKLILHPEVSFFPNWIGVDQIRYYELTDNTLALSTPPQRLQGVQQTAHLVWERIL